MKKRIDDDKDVILDAIAFPTFDSSDRPFLFSNSALKANELAAPTSMTEFREKHHLIWNNCKCIVLTEIRTFSTVTAFLFIDSRYCDINIFHLF